MSVLFVTAFKDIGRQQWNNQYKRNNKTYFDKFEHFVKNMCMPFIYYVEDNIYNQLYKSDKSFIKRYDINIVDTFLNKYERIEQQILDSYEYKKNIPYNRKTNPEHVYAKYNLINHSKINFIKNAKELYPDYTYYCWVDFGIDDIVDKIINFSSIPTDKITYCCFSLPPKIDCKTMLQKDDVYFIGSEFIVPNPLVEFYENKYNEMLIYFHNQMVSDDDQNVVLQLYLKTPELFNPIYTKHWFNLFKYLTNNY